MKGGKLSCNRKKPESKDEVTDDCIIYKCVDYEKSLEPFQLTSCHDDPHWEQFFDNEAKSTYWFNHGTGEARWTEPSDSTKKKRLSGGRNKSKRNKSKRNKSKRKKIKI